MWKRIKSSELLGKTITGYDYTQDSHGDDILLLMFADDQTYWASSADDEGRDVAAYAKLRLGMMTQEELEEQKQADLEKWRADKSAREQAEYERLKRIYGPKE